MGPNGSGTLPSSTFQARCGLWISITPVNTWGRAWRKLHQRRLLDQGKIEKRVGALRSLNSANPEVSEKIRTEADYFDRNAERMRYPNFRCQHLLVGSGVIEAGCKTVIGARLKQS